MQMKKPVKSNEMNQIALAGYGKTEWINSIRGIRHTCKTEETWTTDEEHTETSLTGKKKVVRGNKAARGLTWPL